VLGVLFLALLLGLCAQSVNHSDGPKASAPKLDGIDEVVRDGVATRVAHVDAGIDAPMTKAQIAAEEKALREARVEARSVYAQKLEHDMLDRGNAVIIRAQGPGNSTLYMKNASCDDLALNGFVKGDGFLAAQNVLKFQRVVCADTLGSTWSVSLK